ncbi:MAG: methyltransferase domain-containing protein [Coriobacteriia bacterium]|nr:methyltransferase domain-containing protein [Coriobacteriia bacterium]
MCRSPLTAEGGSLRCGQGHTFDVARHGYVNLLGGGAAPGTADTAEMVTAREAFLGARHYEHIAEALAAAIAGAVRGASAPRVLDVGAGSGYYLAAVLDRMPAAVGLALDISKYAARRAARVHPRASAVVCDAWDRLPVADASVSAVMSVFAPRNPAEFSRVLAKDGIVVTVTPTPRHLTELIDAIGLISVDDRKEERLATSFGEHFARETSEPLEVLMMLGHEDVAALAGMGPSARHMTHPEREARIARLPDPVPVTASVNVVVWRWSRP